MDTRTTPTRSLGQAGAEELEKDWLDTGGVGPMGLPDVLYGLVCIED